MGVTLDAEDEPWVVEEKEAGVGGDKQNTYSNHFCWIDDECMVECTDGGRDGWTDGWMDELTNFQPEEKHQSYMTPHITITTTATTIATRMMATWQHPLHKYSSHPLRSQKAITALLCGEQSGFSFLEKTTLLLLLLLLLSLIAPRQWCRLHFCITRKGW